MFARGLILCSRSSLRAHVICYSRLKIVSFANFILFFFFFFVCVRVCMEKKSCYDRNNGGRVGLVVRALAFHQSGPGSISVPGVICGLSLLVRNLCYERFSPGYSGFPLSSKTSIWFDLWILIVNNHLGNVDLISSRIVKRIWSYSYVNLRYRNIKHYYY